VQAGALNLTSADFDAFLELRSRTTGKDTLAGGAATQRRALRERIQAWAKLLAGRLSELGLPIEVVVPDEVEQHLSSGAPRTIAQRVLFVRDAFARSNVPRTEPELDPLRSHAYLSFTIDSVHVAVSLELNPEAEADVKNTRARIADPTALLELTTLLEMMPDEFVLGVLGVPSFPQVKGATAEDIRALLDDSQRSRRPLWLGWSVKREVALAHANEMDELLGDALVAMGLVYKMCAWAPDNDLIDASRRGAWRARRARAEERRERGREERRKRRQQVRKGPVRKKEGSRREREDARRIMVEREAIPSKRSEEVKEEARAAKEALATPLRRPILPTSLRARGARVGNDVDPSLPIEKGTKVRILVGPFANRLGVVESLDENNRARVRLGLLVATIDLKDLAAAATEARPMLGSSHRRPRNARGR
jgi:hypothetical protein